MMHTISPEKVSDSLLKIKDAFDVFDQQSRRLQGSYETLKRDLDETNRELNDKNRMLSVKVAELKEMSSHLECIQESLADGVLVIDGDLIVSRCNRAAEKLFGKTRKQIEGRSYSEITSGLGNVQALLEVMRTGEAHLDEERISVDARGGKIVVDAGVSPIRYHDDTIKGAVEVLRDVTELRDLQARANSQKKLAALGEMAASVAHEIRNPLGTIEGFARLLRRDLESYPDHVRLASKIVEGVQNLNYVITNLLTYARPLALQIEEFDVPKLFAGVRDVLNDKAVQRQVNLEMYDPAPSFKARGDIRSLRQVFLNLGLNSIEACSSGGKVTVKAVKLGRGSVFTVTDNGCGISEEDMQKLFAPFFTRKEGGTGLGLSLCHKIVSAHAGEINVSSDSGKGSVFEVVLP